MLKKNIYKDIGMVVSGIVLLFILKEKSWSIGRYLFFYMCSGIGSVIGIRFSQKKIKSFIIAALIAMFLLLLGLMIADFFAEGISVLAGYSMWFPVIILLLPLYGLAGALTMFPIMNIAINWIKK